MEDEFETGVCGGSLLNSLRNTFGSSPCSSAINDIGSFGWPSESVDMKERSSDESNSVSGGGAAMDSTLQMMGIGLSSSPTTDWNEALLRGSGRSESNYHPMLQDLNSSFNYRQDWSPKNFSVGESFKPMNQGFSLESITSCGESTVAACQGLSTSFPITSGSNGYPSKFLEILFDTDPQPQQSLFGDQSINYPSTTNYLTDLSEFSHSMPKLPSMLKPSLSKQQPTSSHLHFSNDTRFWNASAAALNDIRANLLPQSQLHTPPIGERLSCPNLTVKPNNEEVRDSSIMVKKSNNEPAFKRPRIETPSPLPTFKVRKEKLGDRITALQQLVSPFGKTDTASVLHEAILYIKFLHDQVNVLSTPYMKNGAPIHRRQAAGKIKDEEGPKQDLKSRGLCLVPISSTFPVAADNTSDFWTPTFGGTFR